MRITELKNLKVQSYNYSHGKGFLSHPPWRHISCQFILLAGMFSLDKSEGHVKAESY